MKNDNEKEIIVSLNDFLSTNMDPVKLAELLAHAQEDDESDLVPLVIPDDEDDEEYDDEAEF